MKKIIWTKNQLETALSVNISDSKENYGPIKFNSQHIEEGDIFVALPGLTDDGHEFVLDALNRGASLAIISKNAPSKNMFNLSDLSKLDQDKLIKVDNSRNSLSLLAEYKRNTSNAKFIAITGSVGKTTTKEMLKMMLTSYGNVHANYGTFNNTLGVELTLASMPDNTDYAIIEMGMSNKGEIRELTNKVIPDIAIITTISKAHLEAFHDLDEIANAKCEIFEGLDITNGIAIINNDMQVYDLCIKNIDLARLKNVKTFGKKKDSSVRFISHEILNNCHTKLIYKVAEKEIEIIIKTLIPIHLSENLGASFAVISVLGLELNRSIRSIAEYNIALGRGNIVSIGEGKKSYDIICDYYNSSPQSLRASLKHFAQLGNKKNKIAILGDMLALGSDKLSLHKEIVPYIKNAKISKLFLVGTIIPLIQNIIPKNISVKSYSNVDEIISDIDKYIQRDELILMKGSRAIGLEKLAKYLGVKDVL